MKFLKEIEDAVKKIRKEIDSVDLDEVARELVIEQYNALMEIVSYINSLKWLNQERTKKKMSFFIKSKFNYKATFEEFGTSLNAIEVFVSEGQKKLKKKIGENTIDMILQGEVETAMIQFNLRTKSKRISPELFLPGIAQLLPEPKMNKFFLVSELQKELLLLVNLSPFCVNRFLKKIDVEKLAHLLYIITIEDGQSLERNEIISLLKGDYAEKDGEQIAVKKQIDNVIRNINSYRLFN